MRTIEIADILLRPSRIEGGRVEQGAFTFIVRGPEIAARLHTIYGRDGLCLKVFKAEATSLDEFCWGKAQISLRDSTRAQNLFALHGFAPRVYDIVLVNGKWAQVTDYVVDDDRPFNRAAATEQVLKRYGVHCAGWDMNLSNWVGSQMVDFQNFYLPSSYVDELVKRAYESAAWGSRTEPYQGLGGFKMESQRDTAHRLQMMGWDRHDWTGKTILDIGCNVGAFCHEAALHGALRVVGVDLPHVAELAYEMANWLGYWNVDFYGLRLPGEWRLIADWSGIEKFDVVLCLSVKQTKPVSWAFDLCGGICYFEGHVPDKEHTWRPTLEKHFDRVEFLEMTQDHGPRPLFRCQK